jgi:hypothetical protein
LAAKVVETQGLGDHGHVRAQEAGEDTIGYPPALSLPPCAAMNMATADRQ